MAMRDATRDSRSGGEPMTSRFRFPFDLSCAKQTIMKVEAVPYIDIQVSNTAFDVEDNLTKARRADSV